MGSANAKKEIKLGQLNLTKNEKIAIAQLVDLPQFRAVESYFRKRAAQIAEVSINAAQDEKDLWFYKGKLNESGLTLNTLKKVRDDLQAEEDALNNKDKVS